MINKFYKRIHNKYLGIFKSIFFLKYLIVVFFIFLSLFLIIPKFFDYDKKKANLEKYLLKNYSFEIEEISNIKYKIFPIPFLELEDVVFKINSNDKFFKFKKILITPKITNIYNYDNFSANKVILQEAQINIDIKKIDLLKKFISQIKKFKLKNVNVIISNKGKPILNLQRINFSNYGYKKNEINGEVFEKEFIVNFKNNFDKLDFKLIKAGVNIEIIFNDKNDNDKFSGKLKGEVLNSNLKLDFIYDKKKLKINNFFFRNRNLSFDNQTNYTYEPFLNVITSTNIKDFNPKLIDKINLDYLLKFKEVIKKINAANKINFKSSRYSKNLIDNINLDTSLTYGRLTFSKKIIIFNSNLVCDGETNLLEEYPILYFKCLLTSQDKKKLLKKFGVKYKNKNEKLSFQIDGRINLIKNQINFERIESESYSFPKNDLKYIKDLFEATVLNKGVFKTFQKEKIKNFILQIS